MNNETKHTPLPWKIGGEKGYNANIITGPDHGGICSVYRIAMHTHVTETTARDEGMADAELIVRAVNSHQDLMDALSATLAALKVAFDAEGDAFGVHHNDATDALSVAEKALAKASAK